jgi:hypothetical protein
VTAELDGCRRGSRHCARRAWWQGQRYGGMLILKTAGYTDR